MAPRGAAGPSSDERREIETLKALIDKTPERPSTLNQSTFMRFTMGEQNRCAPRRSR